MTDGNAFSAKEMQVLRPIFVASGREYLATVTLTLGVLRESAAETEHLGELHRVVHSLKGAALQIGYIHIGRLAEAMEAVVLAVRSSGLGMESDWIDVLERGRARLGDYLGALEAEEDGVEADGGLLNELESLVTQLSTKRMPGDGAASG